VTTPAAEPVIASGHMTVPLGELPGATVATVLVYWTATASAIRAVPMSMVITGEINPEVLAAIPADDQSMAGLLEQVSRQVAHQIAEEQRQAAMALTLASPDDLRRAEANGLRPPQAPPGIGL